jgi:ABC-2 type transport system ATP-binding protein
MTNVIETVDLTRRFGRTEAVNGLTLQVPAGSVFALIGPNGAGKTTTLKLLMNLLRATRGTATVLGSDTRHLGPAGLQRIGYVSENQRLPDWMTPGELFDYCRPFYPTWDQDLRHRLAADLALASRAPLRALSRGTRMKAALLASLAYRPDLVVLDEPFTGLDPVVRDELIRGLLDVSGERTLTVLVSSHDIDEVERLADWVGFMREGRLQFAEPVAALLGRFRLVEVVPSGDTPAVMPADPRWLPHGTAGRTLRFVDTCYDESTAPARIAAAFPACDVRTFPLPLREIFVAIARASSIGSVPATAGLESKTRPTAAE